MKNYKGNYVVVDVETDGPIIGLNSIVCFGAVLIDKNFNISETFYGECKPLSNKYELEALSISGFTRKEHLGFKNPQDVFLEFRNWLQKNIDGQPTLFSDNNGFDASWINYYFHYFLGNNPFGYSSRRIGDLFCGYNKNLKFQWKKFRKTKHTHNPVDDATGNAEALIYLLKQF